MKNELGKYGFRDSTFRLYSVKKLIEQGIIEKPYDGNHGEIHPKGNDFVPSGVPFIMASDIKNGKVNFNNCKHISEQQANSLRKGFAKNGDVLITHKATIGEVAIVNYQSHPYIMLTPQVTYYRVKDYEKLNNRYLRYYFEAEFFKKTLNLWAGAGSTRAYLSIIKQQKLPIVFPDIKKQKEIAAILVAYDDLIENNNKRIALLEKAADEIYREWFVRMRFPGWEKVKSVKGVPEGWDVGSFTDFIDVMSGGTPKTDIPQYWGDEIPWFTPRDLKGSFLVFDTERKITEDGLRHCASKLYPPNTVFITARGTVGNCVMNVVPMAMSQTSYALLGKNDLPQYFVYYLTLNMVATLKQQATGAVFDTIIVDTFRKQNVAIPTKSILDKYTNLITPILEQLKTLLRKNELLGTTRDLLLSRLISGKLPVDDLDIRFPPGMEGESGGAAVRAEALPQRVEVR